MGEQGTSGHGGRWGRADYGKESVSSSALAHKLYLPPSPFLLPLYTIIVESSGKTASPNVQLITLDPTLAFYRHVLRVLLNSKI